MVEGTQVNVHSVSLAGFGLPVKYNKISSGRPLKANQHKGEMAQAGSTSSKISPAPRRKEVANRKDSLLCSDYGHAGGTVLVHQFCVGSMHTSGLSGCAILRS